MGENAVHFDLWDTAGQERFKSLLPMYTRDATVAVIVFDVNDPLSLEEALIQAKENSKLPILALVANKCDLLTNPLQDPLVQEAQKQADLLNINFFVTSAKSGLGVAKMFDSLGTPPNCILSSHSPSKKVNPQFERYAALAAARMLAKPGDPLYSKASPSTSAPESTRDTITLNAETQNAPQSQGFKCWSVFNWFGNSAEGKVSNATS